MGKRNKCYLSDARYLVALRRIRQQIAEGLNLDYEDSTQWGNKYTHCSWGLCSDNAEQWPDAADHLWPKQFKQHGRVAPKYRTNKQPCPFQRELGLNGCFWSCRIFKRKRRQGLPSREEALRLYDERIEAAETVEDEVP